jgi:methyltransferase
MNIQPGVAVAILTGVAVLLVMAGESVLSGVNARFLRHRGAIEAEGDVFRAMRWAYPGAFIAMAIEGALIGPAPQYVLLSGLAVFGFAKALKAWAIAALGPRWTFRVLVLKDAPLVTTGPYRLINHPNYVAVIAELIGVAMIVRAPITGVLAVIGFGSLIRKRIRIEDRALGRSEG